jgi:hypothetical protein
MTRNRSKRSLVQIIMWVAIAFGVICVPQTIIADLNQTTVGEASLDEAIDDQQANIPRPLVGVIRWDGYNGSPKITQQQEFGFLKPEQWHYLAPWFVRRTNDPDRPLSFNPDYDKGIIKEVTDQEIRYASDAGIDYWAFCHFASFKGDGWQLRDNLEAYLASPLKPQINFSLIALGGHIGQGVPGTTNPTPEDVKADWARYVEEYIELMRESTYQRVMGDRPLFFLMQPDRLSVALGDLPAGKGVTVDNLWEAVELLRLRAQEADLGDPYIAGMNSGGIWASVYIDRVGLDAVSAYRPAFGSTEEGTSYAELWSNIRKSFIESPIGTGDDTHRQLIVPLMSGADHTPRHEARPEQFGPQHYEEPLSGEFMSHVQAGLDWTAEHPENCEAQSVLIYAWNEHSEGGRICPTMGLAPDYTPHMQLLDELGQAIKQWEPSGTDE